MLKLYNNAQYYTWHKNEHNLNRPFMVDNGFGQHALRPRVKITGTAATYDVIRVGVQLLYCTCTQSMTTTVLYMYPKHDNYYTVHVPKP